MSKKKASTAQRKARSAPQSGSAKEHPLCGLCSYRHHDGPGWCYMFRSADHVKKPRSYGGVWCGVFKIDGLEVARRLSPNVQDHRGREDKR